MAYIKDSIYNTGLKITVIDEDKLFKKYPQIGFGEEGSIYKYNDKKAIKIYEYFGFREKLPFKFEKLEELGRIKDKSFCFPQGLVGYLDLKKEGYLMELVEPMEKCKDFSELKFLKDTKKMLEYLILADSAIARIHRKGVILGDIKDDNIMINKSGEVKFVDTDNYRYQEYDYDLLPSRSSWGYQIYGKKMNDRDNDILVFTIMALQHFMDGILLKHQKKPEFFKDLIELLDVSKEIKDGLSIIFSDAPNKPYMGKILKKINPYEPIISTGNISRINRKYY